MKTNNANYPYSKKLDEKSQKKVTSVINELNFGIKKPQKSSNATSQIWQIKKFPKQNFFIFKNTKIEKCLDNTGLPIAGR